MQEQAKKMYSDAVIYWNGMPQKRQRFVIGGAVGVLVLAIIIAVVLNVVGSGYAVLYPGMSASESNELLTALGAQNVPTRVTAEGEVMVPTADKDALLLELAAQGFPKSTLTYNIFSDNSGFTTTEFERKQYLLFQTQERLQGTLRRIDNVVDAVVTLNVPDTGSYVWEQTTDQSSASVLITFANEQSISTDQVMGIKNLVATSVPNLSSEMVTVVDSGSGIELAGTDSSGYSVADELRRLGLEAEMEARIEEKILNVLSLGYDAGDIKISSTVVLDYDSMITESMQYSGNEDNAGVLSSETYSAVGGTNIQEGGVVGEQDNTDIPIYVAGEDGELGTVNYTRDNEYLVSYVKSQVEKDQAEIDEVSVSIALRDSELTDQRRTQIIESAAMASNVPRDMISIMPFDSLPEEEPVSGVAAVFSNPIILIAIAGGLLLIVILVLILMSSRRRRKATAAAAAEESAALYLDGVQFNNQTELEAYKQQLKDAAEAGKNTKESVMVEQVRDFAKENPEITAQLIRTWLKGQEE